MGGTETLSSIGTIMHDCFFAEIEHYVSFSSSFYKVEEPSDQCCISVKSKRSPLPFFTTFRASAWATAGVVLAGWSYYEYRGTARNATEFSATEQQLWNSEVSPTPDFSKNYSLWFQIAKNTKSSTSPKL